MLIVLVNVYYLYFQTVKYYIVTLDLFGEANHTQFRLCYIVY